MDSKNTEIDLLNQTENLDLNSNKIETKIMFGIKDPVLDTPHAETEAPVQAEFTPEAVREDANLESVSVSPVVDEIVKVVVTEKISDAQVEVEALPEVVQEVPNNHVESVLVTPAVDETVNEDVTEIVSKESVEVEHVAEVAPICAKVEALTEDVSEKISEAPIEVEVLAEVVSEVARFESENVKEVTEKNLEAPVEVLAEDVSEVADFESESVKEEIEKNSDAPAEVAQVIAEAVSEKILEVPFEVKDVTEVISNSHVESVLLAPVVDETVNEVVTEQVSSVEVEHLTNVKSEAVLLAPICAKVEPLTEDVSDKISETPVEVESVAEAVQVKLEAVLIAPVLVETIAEVLPESESEAILAAPLLAARISAAPVELKQEDFLPETDAQSLASVAAEVEPVHTETILSPQHDEINLEVQPTAESIQLKDSILNLDNIIQEQRSEIEALTSDTNTLENKAEIAVDMSEDSKSTPQTLKTDNSTDNQIEPNKPSLFSFCSIL